MKMISKEPDMIFYNGNVHTIDENNSIVEALAVQGNRVLATGRTKDILALASDSTNLHDLKGRSVIPGIIDSHNHAWEAGRLMDGVVTFGIKSIKELKQRLRTKVLSLPKGTWIQGGGWIETQFTENRMPTRWDLDEVAPDHPVVLERIFSTCVANSKALRLAGITKDTPNPPNGVIDRDKTSGCPTGILFRSAKLLVRNVMPGPFGASSFGFGQGVRESVLRAMNEYVRWGVTGIVEPGVSPAICRVYQDLNEEGNLPLRVNLMPNWHGFALKQEKEHMNRLIGEIGFYTGMGNEWLRLGALKMAIDGGLTSKTAWNSWPYLWEEEPREVELRLDIDMLEHWVKEAHDAGWSVGIHVVGDVSQRKAVDAIYRAYQQNPQIRRHQIIHGYYPTPQSMHKMREAGIIAAVQPAFIYGEADGYPKLLPNDKQQHFLPLKSYLDHGVVVAISTDMPSAHYNPFWNLYCAVTRRGMQGHQLGEEECVSVQQALRMLTINNAYLTGEENIKGSLEPGKLADLVVLHGSLDQLATEDLKDIAVDLTIIDGQVVYPKNN